MAFPRRGSRTMDVDGEIYRWIVSPDSGDMVIVVERDAAPGQRLEAVVRYHDDESHNPSHSARTHITPRVVRRAIEMGLNDGWRPNHPGLAAFQLADADERVWDQG